MSASPWAPAPRSRCRAPGVTLVKGDLAGIARARALSRATMRNIRQNLVFAFVYNALGIPLAAGVLYPSLGLLLSPVIAALAMSLSSVSVIGNALRLRSGAAVARYGPISSSFLSHSRRPPVMPASLETICTLLGSLRSTCLALPPPI